MSTQSNALPATIDYGLQDTFRDILLLRSMFSAFLVFSKGAAVDVGWLTVCMNS